MSDTKIPQKAIDWMNSMNWGAHHDEWHYTRRFYYWPALAQNHPDPAVRAEVQTMVDYATQQNWSATQFQEGAVGSGLDFLAMHRAMLHLLIPRPYSLFPWMGDSADRSHKQQRSCP